MKSIIMALIGIMLLFPAAATTETLLWLITDEPPFRYQEKGVHKGYGIEWQQMMEAEMPQYKHEYLVVNYAKMHQMLKKKKNACVASMYKTPDRKKYIHFTDVPDMLFFPHIIFMREETHKMLGEPKQILLDTLLQNQSLNLGLAKGRNYGPEIQSILNKYQSQSNIDSYGLSTIVGGLFDMLAKKRIDYLMEYLVEGKYFAQQLETKTKLIPVLIEEKKDLLISYAGCSKTDQGLKAAQAINNALIKVKPTPEYRNVYENWLDEDLVPIYRQFYDEKFL